MWAGIWVDEWAGIWVDVWAGVWVDVQAGVWVDVWAGVWVDKYGGFTFSQIHFDLHKIQKFNNQTCMFISMESISR